MTKRRLIWAAGLVAVLVAAAGVGYFLLHREPADSPTVL
jgi:hypothetical protein